MGKEEAQVKRMKKMILLLGVLVILLCSYTLMNHQNESASVNEETGTFDLTAKTADDLTGLEWIKDGENFSFTRTENGWTKTDNADYPVAQNVVETLADNLLNLKANRKLENVTDASIYGLAEPAFTVTAHWSGGSSTSYRMGDETPFGDGFYLSLSNQNGTAYTIATSLSTTFNKTMDDFADMETVPAVAETTRITVGTAFDASWLDESSTINPSQHWYAVDGRALDGVDKLVTAFEGIEWESLVEAVASDAQLTEWKLDDENAVSVTCYDGEESVSILFGTMNESGNYYARLPESTMVYTVLADAVNDLLAASPENMISLALIETDYTDVQEAVLTLGDIDYTLRSPVQEGAEEGTEEDPNETLWKQLTAIEAQQHVHHSETGETMLSVRLTTNKGISAALSFKEYNADSYIVTDGERTMITDANAVDKLIRTIKSMN